MNAPFAENPEDHHNSPENTSSAPLERPSNAVPTNNEQARAFNENALRTSEELFRATFDYSSIGKVLISARDGRFLRVNDRFSAMIGYSREELMRMTFADFTHQEDQQSSNRAFQRLRQGLVRYEADKRYLHKDGRIIWVSVSAAPIRDSSGQVVQIITAIQDITDRKEMERQVVESEAKKTALLEDLRQAKAELELRVHQRTEDLSKTNSFLSSLIENIPNMIFVKDARDLKFVRFNRAGEELVGYSRETLIGKNDFDLFPESEAEFFTSMDRMVLANRATADIPEEPILTREHGVRILHTKKIPVYDSEGNPEYLLGISEDITDKKRAEMDRLKLVQEQEARAEAEKAVQLRDDFLSIAAHELRTPLTPIRMCMQLAKLHVDAMGPELTNAENLRKTVRRMDKEFERFLNLVENLLDVSRISSGRLVLDPHEFDLTELVKNVVDRFGAELHNASCEMQLDIPYSVVGTWDYTRIEQVMTNLLTNAMKYGSQEPIHVRVSKSTNTAQIVVQDHGIGISKEDQERIFQRFERVAPLKHFGGFGLGLFIAREIVIAHRGTIHLTSEPGVGSTFTVELPLSPATRA